MLTITGNTNTYAIAITLHHGKRRWATSFGEKNFQLIDRLCALSPVLCPLPLNLRPLGGGPDATGLLEHGRPVAGKRPFSAT